MPDLNGERVKVWDRATTRVQPHGAEEEKPRRLYGTKGNLRPKIILELLMEVFDQIQPGRIMG